MRLFIIRHGESVNNFLNDQYPYDEYMAKRTPDPELSELGWRQANAVATHLATATVAEHHHTVLQESAVYGITHIYCSAMIRAMQTAQPIAEALGIQPEVWLDLHEQGGLFYGNLRHPESVTGHPGMTRAEMEARFPGYRLPGEVTDSGWWKHGHESPDAFYSRTVKVAEQLRQLAQQDHEQGRDGRIALVVHGDLIDLLMKALLGQLPGHSFRYTNYNTAINRLDFSPNGSIFLRYVNRTEHFTQAIFSGE